MTRASLLVAYNSMANIWNSGVSDVSETTTSHGRLTCLELPVFRFDSGIRATSYDVFSELSQRDDDCRALPFIDHCWKPYTFTFTASSRHDDSRGSYASYDGFDSLMLHLRSSLCVVPKTLPQCT